MAKGKGSIQGWITKNGVHIPIYGTYTVRGGVEPKAKGSKFKRRKRPEEFDKDIREGSGKFWAQHSSPQGAKKGVKDLEKPFETREEARKFLAKENGEYEDTKFTSKTEAGQEKDKYANRDWNKDVDDAKRYGYSEQTEEGKKPVTKAEEEKQAGQSFKDKKAQEQGFADDASMRSYNEETGVNKETWEGQKSSKSKIDGIKENETKLKQLFKDNPEGNFTYTVDGESGISTEYLLSRGLNGKGIELSSRMIDKNNPNKSFGGGVTSTKGSWDTAQRIQSIEPDLSKWEKSSSTPTVSKTDAYNDKVFADFKKNGKDYQRVPMEGYAGTANDFRAAAKRAGVEIEYDKGDDTFYLRKSKQDSLSAGTNERSRIRGELHAKDKAMKAAMPTTVSGLRSAYTEATGSMKSKIASELRRKGYSLVGGKWIKGSKS